MMPVIAEGILIDKPASRISLQRDRAVRSSTVSRSSENRWSMVSLSPSPHQQEHASLVTRAGVTVVRFIAGDMLGLVEDAFPKDIAPRRKAHRLREGKQLFTLGNRFAELSAAYLLFADAGLSGRRYWGEVVLVYASTKRSAPTGLTETRDWPPLLINGRRTRRSCSTPSPRDLAGRDIL